jgi:predicted ribosomally synthesized peptide with nif11-like leader
MAEAGRPHGAGGQTREDIMGMDNLQKFIKDSGRDPAVEKALRAAPTKDDFVRTAVTIGGQKGYSFTEGDMYQAMSNAKIADGQQLTEAQLEAVAGGNWCSVTEWWYQRFTSGAVKC